MDGLDPPLDSARNEKEEKSSLGIVDCKHRVNRAQILDWTSRFWSKGPQIRVEFWIFEVDERRCIRVEGLSMRHGRWLDSFHKIRARIQSIVDDLILGMYECCPSLPLPTFWWAPIIRCVLSEYTLKIKNYIHLGELTPTSTHSCHRAIELWSFADSQFRFRRVFFCPRYYQWTWSL